MKKLCLLLCLLLVGCSAAPSAGEPAHRFARANYQSAKTCLDCGLTEGEPLTPDFIAHDIALDAGDVAWEKTDTGYRATLIFSEQSDPITVIPGIEDYYDISLRDHTETAREEGYSYQVFWQGERQTVTYQIQTEFSGWQEGEEGMENVCTVTWEWKAPAGYDGIVLTLRGTGEWPDGKYLYEIDRTDMLLFRP